MIFQMNRRAESDSFELTVRPGGFLHFLHSVFAFLGGTLDPNGHH